MTAILAELQKVYRLRGDTYSSYEVVDLVGRAATQIERLTAELTTAEFDRLSNEKTIAKLRATLELIAGQRPYLDQPRLSHVEIARKALANEQVGE